LDVEQGIDPAVVLDLLGGPGGQLVERRHLHEPRHAIPRSGATAKAATPRRAAPSESGFYRPPTENTSTFPGIPAPRLRTGGCRAPTKAGWAPRRARAGADRGGGSADGRGRAVRPGGGWGGDGRPGRRRDRAAVRPEGRPAGGPHRARRLRRVFRPR